MKPVIRLKVDELEQLQELYDLNNYQLALKANIAPSQVGRVKKGSNAGADFIAAILTVFPEKTFSELFFLVKPLQESQGPIQELRPTGSAG